MVELAAGSRLYGFQGQLLHSPTAQIFPLFYLKSKIVYSLCDAYLRSK